MASHRPAEAADIAASRPSPSAQISELRNRLLELFGRKLSRREFAEQVAALVAQAAHATAVAVLGYDRRRQRLSALADQGLPPEARSALVGRGTRVWDIPARSLHNRRISVIEAAHQNPFVPPEIVALSPSALTIACIPVYHELKPVASIVLIAGTNKAFPDTDLEILSQAVRACARGLRDNLAAARGLGTEREEEIAQSAINELIQQEAAERARPALAPRGREEDPDAATVALHLAEIERGQLAEARHVTETLLGRVQRLEQDLARAHAELEHSAKAVRELTTARHALTRERDRLSDQLGEIERQRERDTAELTQQAAALEERLLALESERMRAQRAADTARATALQSASALDQERETLRERLRAAEATVSETRTALTTLRADRDHLAAQSEASARQSRAQEGTFTNAQARFAEERAALAADRDGWQERATALQAQVVQRTEAHRSVAHELRAAVADRDTLAQQLARARAEIDDLRGLHDELAARVGQLDAARATAAGEAAALQETLDRERADGRQREDALQAALAAARAGVAADAAALRGDLEAGRQLLADRDAQLAAIRSELADARDALASWEQSSATLQAELAELQAQLAQAAADRDRASEEGAALRRQLSQALGRRGDGTRALAADLQSAQERLSRAEREREASQAALTAVQQRLAQHEAAQAEAAAHAEEQLAALRAEVAEHAAARATAQRQLEDAERAGAEHRAAVAAEAARAAALGEQQARLEQARAELARDLARTRDEVEALRQHAADRGALARQTTELGAQIAALEEALAAARAEADAARADETRAAGQCAALTDELQAARRREEQLAAGGREQEALRAELAAAAESQRRAQEEHAAASAAIEADRAAHTAAVGGLQAELERARAERDEAVRAREQYAANAAAELAAATDAATAALEEVRVLTQRLAEKQRRVDDLTGVVRERETAIAAARAEHHRLEEHARAADEAIADLQSERAELHNRIDAAVDELETERRARAAAIAEIERDFAKRLEAERRAGREREERARVASQLAMDVKRAIQHDAPLVIERSAPLGTVVSSGAEPIVVSDPARGAPAVEPAGDDDQALSEVAAVLKPGAEIVLVDEGTLGDEARGALAPLDATITLAPPAPTTVDDLARRKVAAVLLNLAGGPSSWQLVKALRSRVGTRNVPILAYLMTPDAPTGFCFGRADFLLWPADPSRILEQIRLLRPNLRRLLVASHDIDRMGKIREPLTRAGVSTSLVLDGRQARDIAASTRPEAAILHLSPDCNDIARTVAGFRSAGAGSELPLLIVLDKDSAGREEAFLTALNRELLRSGTFELGDLGAELAQLLA